MNQPRLPLIALGVLLAAGASVANDPAKVPHRGAVIWDDLQELQGDWRIVEQHLGNGVSNAVDPTQEVISIRGTAVRAEINGKVVWESAFKLYPNQSPKAMDWYSKGFDQPATSWGSYAFEGGRLRICKCVEERPREFKAVSRGWVETWERVRR